MAITAASLTSDPVSAVRGLIVAAQDRLLAGDWADAEQALTAAVAALGGARASEPAASFACGGLTPNQRRRLVRHVEDRLSDPLSLQDLAQVAKLSPSHFCRMFRESFGLPPLHYVQQRRVERAKTLMLTTDDPLASIALACGLYDQPALCKVFRRLTGQSPAAWRRRRRA